MSTHALASTAMDMGEDSPSSSHIVQPARSSTTTVGVPGALGLETLAADRSPVEPARCLVSGTGLTHFGSARDCNAMHVGAQAAEGRPTACGCSEAGVERGRPAPGEVGVAPEWFYKGGGTMLRGHGEPLVVPGFAEDGGEEAEIAGVYVIGGDGTPCRSGCDGERVLRPRLRAAELPEPRRLEAALVAIGPELALTPEFDTVPGEVRIERRRRRGSGRARWPAGEAEMSHSLRNIEHHHFKFDAHRRPGDVHVHFFGAHSLSFGAGIALEDGDVMCIRFDGFGRPLRNVVRVEAADRRPVEIKPL